MPENRQPPTPQDGSKQHGPQKNGPGRTDLQSSLQTANRLLKQEEYTKALEVCVRYLDVAPDAPDMLNLAGIISELNQQPEQAADYFHRAIHCDPGEALFHYNLANLLKKSGNTGDAIKAYQTASNLAPGNQTILRALGNLYLSSGDAVMAIQIYGRMLHISPADDTSPISANQQLQRILHDNPGHIRVLRNLGIALRQQGQLEAAVQCFVTANKISPGHGQTLANLGDIYYLLDRPAEAELYYRQALDLIPDNARLYSNLGIVLDNQGKSEEARRCYRQAIQADATFATAHKLLAYAVQHTDHDQDIRNMERLLGADGLDTTQQACLQFGLGKAYEDLQEYDRSFSHYAAANELERSAFNYQIEDDERLISNIIRRFKRERFESLSGCGDTDNRPIFIVGMPRSGTTLAEQILTSHPDVHGGGELMYLHNIIQKHFRECLHGFFPEHLDKLDCESVTQLGRQYLDKTKHYSNRAGFLTDKMPQNFLYLGMIKLMLPGAKIIHCKRNPLDTCASCFFNSFREAHQYAYNLQELGHYYLLYHRLMDHWQQLMGDDIIEFSYEALVDSQENATRQLLAACGLEWDEACMSFHETDRAVMTASMHQVRRGLYSQSVRRWKHYERHLGPLISVLRSGLPDRAFT